VANGPNIFQMLLVIISIIVIATDSTAWSFYLCVTRPAKIAELMWVLVGPRNYVVHVNKVSLRQ